MTTYQVTDPDGWVRSVYRTDWRLFAVKPYQVSVSAPHGRHWPERAWTEDGGWKLSLKIKRRAKGKRR